MTITEFDNEYKTTLNKYKENTQNLETIATNYLHENKLATSIKFDKIINWLTNGTSASNWMNLFMIERTKPYITNRKVRPNWINRILYFVNSYIFESYLDKKTLVYRNNPVQFRFTRDSGDHTVLETGSGTNVADFYFWINNKANYVEYKYSAKTKYPTINDVQNYYTTNKTSLHNADTLVSYLESENKLYVIDLANNHIEPLWYPAPQYLPLKFWTNVQ